MVIENSSHFYLQTNHLKYQNGSLLHKVRRYFTRYFDMNNLFSFIAKCLYNIFIYNFSLTKIIYQLFISRKMLSVSEVDKI